MSERPLLNAGGHRARSSVARASTRYAVLALCLVGVHVPTTGAIAQAPSADPGGIVAPPTIGQSIIVSYVAVDGTEVDAKLIFHAYAQRTLDALFLDPSHLAQVVTGALSGFRAEEAAGREALAQLIRDIQRTFTDTDRLGRVTLDVISTRTPSTDAEVLPPTREEPHE